jgi:hypothetical protein
MQRLLELSTGFKIFKAKKATHFDTADVIVSEPYGLQIDDSGQLTEMVLYLRILNEDKRMYGLTLYEMPLNTGEKYQEPLRIQNKNYFERTIHNLPQVLSILNKLGYEFDNNERYIG